MGIFSFFFKTCAICKKKKTPMSTYLNDRGEEINVCHQCREYAERRAFIKQ